MRAGQRSERDVVSQGLAAAARAIATPVEVSEKLCPSEDPVRERVGVLIEGCRRHPWLEVTAQVVIEAGERVVAEEPGCRAMQSALWEATHGGFIRPQIRLPEAVRAVRQCRLHQPQCALEVARDAHSEYITHAFCISDLAQNIDCPELRELL